MGWIAEYQAAGLLFLYDCGGQLWGQWDTRPGLLPKYKTAKDKRSPTPPEPDFTTWKGSNRVQRTAFPKIYPNVSGAFPRGIGVGIGKDFDNDTLATPVQPERISPNLNPADIEKLKSVIAEYMQETPDDALVIDTLEAGCGFPADDICTHLKALWVKGCKTGKAKGPHTFGWFVAVTRQYFSELRAMEEARLNPNAVAPLKQAPPVDTSELDAGMEAF
jgi:hypothetical protein